MLVVYRCHYPFNSSERGLVIRKRGGSHEEVEGETSGRERNRVSDRDRREVRKYESQMIIRDGVRERERGRERQLETEKQGERVRESERE